METPMKTVRCMIEADREARVVIREYNLKVLSRGSDFYLVELSLATMAQIRVERPNIVIEYDHLQRA